MVHNWFWANDLQLNPDKSDAAVFGTVPGFKKAGLSSTVIVVGCSVHVSDRLKILGIILDSALTFENHVKDVVETCTVHMHAQRRLRRPVTRDVANTLSYNTVDSRIDYCNALLFGATDKVFDMNQRVQNNLARIVNNVCIRQLAPVVT